MPLFVKLSEGVVNVEAFVAFERMISKWDQCDSRQYAYYNLMDAGISLPVDAWLSFEEFLLENRQDVRWVEIDVSSNGKPYLEVLLDVTKIAHLGFSNSSPGCVRFGPRLEWMNLEENGEQSPKAKDAAVFQHPLELTKDDFLRVREVVKPLLLDFHGVLTP